MKLNKLYSNWIQRPSMYLSNGSIPFRIAVVGGDEMGISEGLQSVEKGRFQGYLGAYSSYSCIHHSEEVSEYNNSYGYTLGNDVRDAGYLEAAPKYRFDILDIKKSIRAIPEKTTTTFPLMWIDRYQPDAVVLVVDLSDFESYKRAINESTQLQEKQLSVHILVTTTNKNDLTDVLSLASLKETLKGQAVTFHDCTAINFGNNNLDLSNQLYPLKKKIASDLFKNYRKNNWFAQMNRGLVAGWNLLTNSLTFLYRATFGLVKDAIHSLNNWLKESGEYPGNAAARVAVGGVERTAPGMIFRQLGGVGQTASPRPAPRESIYNPSTVPASASRQPTDAELARAAGITLAELEAARVRQQEFDCNSGLRM